jgi:polyhydroxyalkanoate synthesis regulator phasin
MSDDKGNVSDKASEIAKNIWLAGLGAYGKAFDEAQDRLDKVSKEPPRLFKDLVKKGEELEDEVRDSLASIRKTSTSSVEERIRKVRENFHFNLAGRSAELAEINAKLDALTRKVDAIARALAADKKPAGKVKRKAPAGKAAPGARAASKTTRRKKS